MEISTSILTVKEENATKTFYNLETAGTDYYHIDVMDGKFVEKDTQISREVAREIQNSGINIVNVKVDGSPEEAIVKAKFDCILQFGIIN